MKKTYRVSLAALSILLAIGWLAFYGAIGSIQAASNSLIIERFSYQSTPSEYVKIMNISAAPINLSGYRIGDEETSGQGEGMYDLPNINLAAGGSIVIATDADGWTFGTLPDYSFLANTAGVPTLASYPAWGTGAFGLANTGDEIVLMDSSNAYIDGVCYGTSTCNWNGAGANTILTGGPLADLPSGEAGYERVNTTDTDTRSDWVGNPTAIHLLKWGGQSVAGGSTPVIAGVTILTVGGLGLLWLKRRRQ